MKKIIILLLLTSATSAGHKEEDIFTDYCRPGLCKYVGGDGAHTGCKNGIAHNLKFQYPPCPEDAELIPLTDSEKQFILDLHNVQRNFVACGGLFKDHKLGPGCRHGVVTWDKELEKTAFLHTSYCTFAHDKCRNTVKYPFSGQNLGLLTYNVKPNNASFYINIISYLWYLEYTYTKMDMIDKFYHQTDWMVGHFLTSLNERNNRVGCTFAKFYAKDRKKNVVMLSCNYPTTNIARSTIYNSCKKPASQCVTGTDPKYKFLCSSEEDYDVNGVLNHIEYDGGGAELFENCGKEPELFHYANEGCEEVRKQHLALYPNKPMPAERPDGYTTKKPASAAGNKPITITTKGSTKKPSLDFPKGNPNASGIPDYSEDDYDDIDSSSVKLWQKQVAIQFLVQIRTSVLEIYYVAHCLMAIIFYLPNT